MSNVDSIMKELDTKKFNLTDSGNAEMIASIYGDRVRYDRRRQRWLIWNNHIWKPEKDNITINQFAKEAARKRYQDAIKIDSENERKFIAKWAISSESRQKIDAAVALVKGELPILDSGLGWDKDPWLFACKNGIINLKTGVLRDGRQEDRITLSSPIIYDSSASTIRWEKFLDEVFQGNKDLIHYLHKALGYSLTGIISEQALFVGHGKGGNGKSKLFEIIRYILGDYAREAAPSTFYKVYNRNNDFELPALEGVRLITVAENNEASALDTQRIKRFSGGDPITAAEKHKNEVTFTAVGKLWLYFNNKPQVTDTTISIWDRLKLIPFKAEFRNTSKEDKNLGSKLQAEAPGILAWLVKGCLIWQSEGLKPVPQVVTTAIGEYQRENDWLADFLFQCCDKDDSKLVKSSEIYNCYKEWAKKEGFLERDIKSLKAFGIRMRQEFTAKPKTNGIYYLGVDVKSVKDNSSFSNYSPKETSIEENIKKSTNPTSTHENLTKSFIDKEIEDFEIPDEL